MKRILIFSLTYIPFVGGAEVAIKEITDRLDKKYELDMITIMSSSRYPRLEKIGNVNIYRVGFNNNQSSDLVNIGFIFKLNKFLYPFFAFLKAVSLDRKNKYNAVWSIMAAYAGFAGLFFKLIKPKVKFILTLQEGDTPEHVKKKAGPSLFLLKKIFKKADYIQAISNYLVSFAREFDYHKDIIVIPNGVDTSKFTSVVKHNVTDNKFKIITTSRLIEKNGLKDLILSLKYLDKNYTLDILGSGPAKESLVDLVNSNKLVGRVNFVGSLNQVEMITYLNQSDIFVRPSLSEGLGNSFLEAMAVGLPIIGTRVGGIVDFLIDGETGLFCKINDPEDVANKIVRLKMDVDLRLRLINNGQKLVIKKYDWNTIVGRFKSEIFDKIA